MTLPTEIIFPLSEERLNSADPREIGSYVRDLVRSLTTMYQELSQSTNGDIREFHPKITGDTTPGSGTYTNQDGWYLRKGLMVDYWFGLSWTAHTGVGHAYIELPYKVKKTTYPPFVGEVHGQYNYGGGYTGLFSLGGSSTFKNYLYAEGPGGLAFLPLQLLTSGTLFGHIRYVGQEIEN